MRLGQGRRNKPWEETKPEWISNVSGLLAAWRGQSECVRTRRLTSNQIGIV